MFVEDFARLLLGADQLNGLVADVICNKQPSIGNPSDCHSGAVTWEVIFRLGTFTPNLEELAKLY
ncbi:hypothetical protein T265_12222 [Opisthorchis viverrini]|uniref:Uncharacterized protein n=1 Tax=Opisthorchis viverrini TaxID=6198 RepID=A0A074ZTN1_OPIVI|nr:hypothetical protein T265_12222 [Opisthorchis viverrini]KER18594.1 hypothetical protein T265_12222 [Opisthorchis viverrini]